MAVGIKDACGIVVFVETQPQSRLSIVSAASGKCGPVKCVNRRASLCSKCDIKAADNGATAADIELRRPIAAEAGSMPAVFAIELHQRLYAEGRERSHKECPTQCEVL